MIIERLQLFKTPLDVTHRNVIDFIKENVPSGRDYNKLYLNTLLKSFPNYLVTTPANIRATKCDERGCTITLPRSYTQIKQYNYISFRNMNDVHTYGFITNITSENESETNPSCTLTVLFDVWANNIEYLTTGTAINKTTCKHYDRSYMDNGYVKPKYLYRLDNKFDVTKSIYRTDRYKVLFLVLEIAPNKGENINKYPYKSDIYLKDNIDPSTYNKETFVTTTLTSNYYRKDLLYCPVGVINENTGKLISGSIKSSVECQLMLNNVTFTQYNKIYKTYGRAIGGALFGELTSYITKAYYTTHSPFYYSPETPNIIIDMPILELPVNENESVPVICALGDKNGSLFTQIQSDEVLLGSYSQYKIINPYNETYSLTLGIGNIDATQIHNTIYSNITSEPVFNRYPFKYKSIFYNHEEIIIDNISIEGDQNFEIDITNETAQSKLTCYIDDKKFMNVGGEYLKNSGLITYSIDALDDYLIRNGNAINIEKMNLNFKGIKSLLTGATKSILTFANSESSNTSKLSAIGNTYFDIVQKAFDYHSFNSKFDDLENTPPTVHSYTGEDDTYYQDRCIIIDNEATDTVNRSKAMFDVYLYGYNLNDTGNILTNCRRYFDFIKTENCSLLGNLSEYERTELQSIFNRGVIKNHAWINGNTIIPPSFIHDITSLNNYEFKYDIDNAYLSLTEV